MLYFVDLYNIYILDKILSPFLLDKKEFLVFAKIFLKHISDLWIQKPRNP